MEENYNRYLVCFIMVMIMDRHQASATAFLHLFPYKMQGKKCYSCCIQRCAKSHICSKMLFLSAHSFHILDICLLHWLYGTMPPSCSVIPRSRGNWLATPQLVASGTQRQRDVKKAVRLFCIPGTTHSSAAELDHRSCSMEVPLVTWLCAVGLASATEKLLP